MSQLFLPSLEFKNYDKGAPTGADAEDNESSKELIRTEEESVFDKLPDELLLHVFTFLPIFDIKSRAALTCKRWWEVSKHSSLIVEVYFGPYQDSEIILRVSCVSVWIHRFSFLVKFLAFIISSVLSVILPSSVLSIQNHLSSGILYDPSISKKRWSILLMAESFIPNPFRIT